MTCVTPRITAMRVIPIAARDSMLLKLCGAHGPFLTRNLLLLTDSAGPTGVGELPGCEKIRLTLEDARERIVGQPLGSQQRRVQQVQRRFADRDAGGVRLRRRRARRRGFGRPAAPRPLAVSRKTPIVAGMLWVTSMIACNDVDSATSVVAIRAFACFGKGLGALGWAVVSDTSPKEIAGLSAALFNTFGNTAAITTPIVIGYLVTGTGPFGAVLVFVTANALVAVIRYLVVVGEIKRVVLTQP